MAWVMFSPTGSKSKSRASISTTGSISFTGGVEQQFKVDRNRDKFANLYYDNITQKIGIQFVSAKGPATVKTNFRKEPGFWFSGKAFLFQFKIMPKATNLYEIEEENGMIVIKLDTARERMSKKTQLKNSAA
jgi:hypothetical protein